MRVGSVLILLAAFALLGLAFDARFYRGFRSSLLLTVVLIVLGAAIVLHIRFLLRVHKEQNETSRALNASELEYKSVFDNVLDGIVVFDDHGICLEANPSALLLLGSAYENLIGRPIDKLFTDAPDFRNTWKDFVDGKCAHNETQILRPHGTTIFVEYTVRANYLLGRHVAVLRDISDRKRAEVALRESEGRFQQMANNIQEVFWMLDAPNRKLLYVNPAYQTITGRSPLSVKENPKSHEDAIHPADRVRVLSRLSEALQTGQFDEEFRILRNDNTTRWVMVRGFPVRDSAGSLRRLVGTAQDITARKSAEEQIARNLDAAEAARAEAEAFRKTSLALTQNLSMDYVLDTLLQSLLKLVPCESAQILLVEGATRLFLAREVQNCDPSRLPRTPATFDARDSRLFMEILATKQGLLIADTSQEHRWVNQKGFSHLRAWLCVPLVASQKVLGFLSLGDTRAGAFTQDHMRLARSLAIPAAVAIQNARLYECAQIYGAELENRLAELEVAQHALRLSEKGRSLSEERFTKVFRSSPVPFSITTIEEDRFVEVNEAFEKRYGYSRGQLVGRTVSETGVWSDPSERSRLLEEVRRHGSVRHRAIRFRRHDGEFVDALVSAEAVELDGRDCLLTVSEDSLSPAKLEALSAAKTAAARPVAS